MHFICHVHMYTVCIIASVKPPTIRMEFLQSHQVEFQALETKQNPLHYYQIFIQLMFFFIINKAVHVACPSALLLVSKSRPGAFCYTAPIIHDCSIVLYWVNYCRIKTNQLKHAKMINR